VPKGAYMAEEIRDLIEKIQQEGLKVAEEKARDIESAARRQAEEIVKKAQDEAEKLTSEARERIAKMQESSIILLKQSARDMILGLKKEINAVLDRLIVTSMRQALSPEELAKILTTLIKNYSGKEKIIILLKKEDLQKLEKGFQEALAEEAKKDIVLRSQDDIQGGFIISYDEGKSHYDFTDRALAEYIGTFLKPKLKEILQ